jgi:hypothetical protein
MLVGGGRREDRRHPSQSAAEGAPFRAAQIGNRPDQPILNGARRA